MTKEVMVRLVSGCRKAKKASEILKPLYEGHGGVCEDIYGELMDALYLAIGETTETLIESVTYRLISGPTSDSECAEILTELCNRNPAFTKTQESICQPAPVFGWDDEKRDMRAGYRAGDHRV